MDIEIICPNDKQILVENELGNYICPLCNNCYPKEDGVIRILKNDDSFYEGAYENQISFMPKSEKLSDIWPLWLINSGYLWLVRRLVPKNSLVIELGCASGVKYFGKRYTMTGCDLSFKSLKNLNGIYSYMLQSDAKVCIPLLSNTVDAIVSSFFWEHISPEIKPEILKECYRVLKPEGKLIFLYDVETKNPLINYYKKKNINLYNKLFIEGDGHIGYQSPVQNAKLYENAGFKILLQQGMEKTFFQLPSVYTKLVEFGSLPKILFGWTKILGEKPWFYLYTGIVRLIDTIICPLLPKSWSRIEMVVCKKVS